MSLPTPTKKDIEAADETMRDYSQPNSSVDANLFFAATVYRAQFNFERALALKRIEAMFDEVAHEIADFFGRPCTDSVVYEKIIAIKEKRIRDYKQATGIGDDKDKVFISCEQKRSTEIL